MKKKLFLKQNPRDKVFAALYLCVLVILLWGEILLGFSLKAAVWFTLTGIITETLLLGTGLFEFQKKRIQKKYTLSDYWSYTIALLMLFYSTCILRLAFFCSFDLISFKSALIVALLNLLIIFFLAYVFKLFKKMLQYYLLKVARKLQIPL